MVSMQDEEIISRFRDAAELLERGTTAAEVADFLRATANRLEREAVDSDEHAQAALFQRFS
jgi:hypothetical protein